MPSALPRAWHRERAQCFSLLSGLCLSASWKNWPQMEAAQEPGCIAGLYRRKPSQKESLWNKMFPGCSQSAASSVDSTALVWEVGGCWEILLKWGREVGSIDQCPRGANQGREEGSPTVCVSLIWAKKGG